MSVDWRKRQLRQLKKLFEDNAAAFKEALRMDLHMDPLLQSAEVEGFMEDIDLTLNTIDEWVASERVGVPLTVFPGKAQIVKEPYGVVLLISPWNYPVSLIVRPLVGVIAAGNAVIIKPSEISENVSRVVCSTFPKYLDTNLIQIISGGPRETQVLLQEPFDKICYTGSTAVGKLVMKAAAEHLTPVTLELGGKSPLVVDKAVNVQNAVKRIIWGKFANAGQTCVAPDYALIHKDRYEEFLKAAKDCITKYYGENPKESADFGRVVSVRHVRRLQEMIEDSKDCVVCGGEVDAEERYVAPTLLSAPSPSSKVMSDEIFGPLFPLFPVASIEEAIQIINSRPKPLALYIFSSNTENIDRIIKTTSSGGVGVNETVLHNICRGLPFGGVGPSGMGAYNGKFSFSEFSHSKAVLQRSLGNDPGFRFPPYTPDKVTMLQRIGLLRTYMGTIKKVGFGLLVLFTALAIQRFLSQNK
uniref:Aldehyde dehydrogenase n=1 Tax=Arcella intermedia TaxID=1963864 RepID=A0A6B2L2K2_9EUKA